MIYLDSSTANRRDALFVESEESTVYVRISGFNQWYILDKGNLLLITEDCIIRQLESEYQTRVGEF